MITKLGLEIMVEHVRWMQSHLEAAIIEMDEYDVRSDSGRAGLLYRLEHAVTALDGAVGELENVICATGT